MEALFNEITNKTKPPPPPPPVSDQDVEKARSEREFLKIVTPILLPISK
jgi:hypothetical protein